MLIDREPNVIPQPEKEPLVGRTHPLVSSRVRRLAAGLAALSIFANIVFPSVVLGQTPPSITDGTCKFPIFNDFRLQVPLQTGDCIDNPSYDGLGDVIEHTTKGLFVAKQSDHLNDSRDPRNLARAYFTDGSQTLISYGPPYFVHGIQTTAILQRLNTQKFDWETDPTPEQIDFLKLIAMDNLTGEQRIEKARQMVKDFMPELKPVVNMPISASLDNYIEPAIGQKIEAHASPNGVEIDKSYLDRPAFQTAILLAGEFTHVSNFPKLGQMGCSWLSYTELMAEQNKILMWDRITGGKKVGIDRFSVDSSNQNNDSLSFIGVMNQKRDDFQTTGKLKLNFDPKKFCLYK